MNVPKLRFKEFNDESYRKDILKNIISYIADNRGKNPDYYLDSGIPVIDNFMIQNQGYPDLSRANRYIDDNIYENFIRKAIEYNDTLITLVGNGIGNICLTPKEKCVIIQNTLGLRTNKFNDKKYLYHLLTYKNSEIKKLDRGMAQPSIRQDELLKLEVTIPNINEQLKISNFLSLLDKKIELQSKKIEDLKLFKSSQIINFFNKNNFAEVNIKNIGFFQSGNSLSKDCLTSSGVPIILYGDLYTKYNEVIKKVEQYTNDNKKYVKSKQNQIIFPTSTTVNSLSLISPSSINLDGIIYGGDILILNLNKDVNADFLSYEINHYKKKEFSKIAQGSTIIHIHAEDLLNCKIALPNIVLQDKFALTFNKLNQKIELENNKLNKLQKLKKGLMQSMFV